MRTLILGFLAATALAACDDTGTPPTPDLSMPSTTVTCLQVATCASKCAAGATSCLTDCQKNAKTATLGLYQAVVTCRITQCVKPGGDGGAPACSSQTDTSATCVACITAQSQGAACATQLGACVADKG